ncbi:STAS domain-containing protein [Paenibacillus athensensis]|uniref:Anti-sigma factor antagonist n=1 Tax=Paenibacillus athensensis TaxID=1967502 RepID=A0A4Y8PYD6_9BACL|nr:STAS domain-containing protein [Paenibacillus athensensis]MCD1261205.1 STAS domain-containing protein [Paenibacillus athensensis]
MNTLRKFYIFKESDETENKVYLSGELDLFAAPELAATVETLVADEDRALVLDLRELKYIDSTGIGILVSMLKARAGMKRPFHIQHIPNHIRRLLDLTGVGRYLTGSFNTNTQLKREESL